MDHIVMFFDSSDAALGAVRHAGAALPRLVANDPLWITMYAFELGRLPSRRFALPAPEGERPVAPTGHVRIQRRNPAPLGALGALFDAHTRGEVGDLGATVVQGERRWSVTAGHRGMRPDGHRGTYMVNGYGQTPLSAADEALDVALQRAIVALEAGDAGAARAAVDEAVARCGPGAFVGRVAATVTGESYRAARPALSGFGEDGWHLTPGPYREDPGALPYTIDDLSFLMGSAESYAIGVFETETTGTEPLRASVAVTYMAGEIDATPPYSVKIWVEDVSWNEGSAGRYPTLTGDDKMRLYIAENAAFFERYRPVLA